MIHLLVAQLFLVAAAISCWRFITTGYGKRWPAPLLASLGIASAMLELQFGYSGTLVSAAAAAVLTCALWVLLSFWKPIPLAGGICSMVAAAALAPLFLLDSAPVVADQAEHPTGAIFHIVAAASAFSMFTLAAWQAAAVVWLSSKIKQHNLSAYPGAGSLEHNEAAWFTLASIAWVLVLLALLTGVPFVYDVLSQHLSHKIFFAVLAWLLLTVLLVGRRYRGWRDKTVARWMFGGWAALVMGWLGTKLILANLAIQ